jgi:hypothetical protein
MDMGIRLDKNTYEAGEIAKGTLFTKANNIVKVRKLKFSVCGKERYVEEMIGEHGGSTEKYDVFFFEDLYPPIESTNVFPLIDDMIDSSNKGMMMIEVNNLIIYLICMLTENED